MPAWMPRKNCCEAAPQEFLSQPVLSVRWPSDHPAQLRLPASAPQGPAAALQKLGHLPDSVMLSCLAPAVGASDCARPPAASHGCVGAVPALLGPPASFPGRARRPGVRAVADRSGVSPSCKVFESVSWSRGVVSVVSSPAPMVAVDDGRGVKNGSAPSETARPWIPSAPVTEAVSPLGEGSSDGFTSRAPSPAASAASSILSIVRLSELTPLPARWLRWCARLRAWNCASLRRPRASREALSEAAGSAPASRVMKNAPLSSCQEGRRRLPRPWMNAYG
eukprot:scaffold347_cov380-Prasinococcus_capsulatus_cf.AAC.27